MNATEELLDNLTDGNDIARATVLLGLLGNPPMGRLRAAWIERHGTELVIAIFTRNGGEPSHAPECTPGRRGREVHCIGCQMEVIRAHPLYRGEADDLTDSSYSTVYFGLPELDVATATVLRRIAVDPVDTTAQWRHAEPPAAAG
jgi:hypothetical protein